MGWGWDYRPYVSVAKRRAQAAKQMERLRKKGADVQPVCIEGRKIATTFWGSAWCEHLEKFSDYANRLPRGRTYVRNGSVCHLGIKEGTIEAKVSGSEIYNIKIKIKTLPADKWKKLKAQCAGQVGSMLELLQGKISKEVMAIVTDRDKGLFPSPKEINLDCSCPDWATMCKHVAAVLYGVGARLDKQPELLFLLRGVDHAELVSEETAKAVVKRATGKKGRTLDESSLSDVFGIELGEPDVEQPVSPKKPVKASKKKADPAKTSRKKATKPRSTRAKAAQQKNGEVAVKKRGSE